MGKRYLIDSNSIIDFFNRRLPETGHRLISSEEPIISIITQIEIFSGQNIPEEELLKLKSFMKIVLVHPVNMEIALQTISIRQKYKIKLPDAIIAATALLHNYTLITRNTSDFRKIAELKSINPHNIDL